MIHIPTAPWAHTVFDIASWSAAATLGAALNRWRLKANLAQIAHTAGPGYFVAVAIGALPGAWLAGSANTIREAVITFSHSVAGALAGAIAAVEMYKLVRGIKISTGTIFVGPFAIGMVIGRWGCLFAGLPDHTYGIPTTLAWGVDLGDGIARHPVQIYESLSMAAFLAIYLLALQRHATWAIRRSFHVMVVWYGAQRFAWEFLKPYPSVIGPLNVFHLISLGLVIYGCAFTLRDVRAAAAGLQPHSVA